MEDDIDRAPTFLALVMEKLPWLLLSAAASCAIAVAAQAALRFRAWTVCRSRCGCRTRSSPTWLTSGKCSGRSIWPFSIPIRGSRRQVGPWSAALLLAALSVSAIAKLRKRCPYLLIGWLWYLGLLVPVIGVVQVGRQAMADRYTLLARDRPLCRLGVDRSRIGLAMH